MLSVLSQAGQHDPLAKRGLCTLSNLPALAGEMAPAFASAPISSASMVRMPGLCCIP